MELESSNGTPIPIEPEPGTIIGRGLGLGPGTSSSDLTVSRRHLCLRLLNPIGAEDDEDNDSGSESMVSFEVIGKNPILVCTSSGKRLYRRSEKGDLFAGDRISLSLKHPYFFVLKRAAVDKRVLDAVERRERRTRERRKEREKAEGCGGEGEVDDAIGGLDLELGSLDVSQIDPVKEFGFLVIGHEFEYYPGRRIRPARNWNWFLEERRRDANEDDEEVMGEPTSSKRKGRGRRKKKGDENVDEEWTGESEDERELSTEVGRYNQPTYSTRSKEPKKPRKDAFDGRKSGTAHKDEYEEENEDDETLGGFIVDDEEAKEEEGEDEEEFEDEEVSDED